MSPIPGWLLVELKPFVAAIEVRIPMIMTGHILLAAVDPGVPVTLSERFVRNVLRAELGFDGVIGACSAGCAPLSVRRLDALSVVDRMPLPVAAKAAGSFGNVLGFYILID